MTLTTMHDKYNTVLVYTYLSSQIRHPHIP